MRHHFDDPPGVPMLFSVDGKQFSLSGCEHFAVITNVLAGIEDLVLKTRDGRFIRLTVVSEEEQLSATGIQKGWYVACFISADDAELIRKSWSVMREDQPGG